MVNSDQPLQLCGFPATALRNRPDPARLRRGDTGRVAELRSGDPLIVFDDRMTVVDWNGAAEELTGIDAEDAIGRPCWQVLGGVDEDGAVVCHAGCATAKLARHGFRVPTRDIRIKTGRGRRAVSL